MYDTFFHTLDETSFSAQLKEELKNKRMIFTRDELQLSTIVGQGEFENVLKHAMPKRYRDEYFLSGESGLVYKAYLSTPLGKELVAVKTGKGIAIIQKYFQYHTHSVGVFTQTDTKRLAKEVSTMLSFEHRNVMSLIGVCIDGGMPLLIIMPFMFNGSVLDFVKYHKDKFLCSSHSAAMVNCSYSKDIREFTAILTHL